MCSYGFPTISFVCLFVCLVACLFVGLFVDWLVCLFDCLFDRLFVLGMEVHTVFVLGMEVHTGKETEPFRPPQTFPVKMVQI